MFDPLSKATSNALMGQTDYDVRGDAPKQYQKYAEQAQGEKAMSENTRQGQQGLGEALFNQMQGRGPSVAQEQLKQGMSMATQNAASQAYSGRGSNTALANRAATQSAGAISAQGAAAAGQLRAGEQLAATQQLANVLQTQRMQDLLARGYSIDEAKAQLGAYTQEENMRNQASMQNASNAQSGIMGVAALAGTLGIAASDENVKTEVTPVGTSMQVLPTAGNPTGAAVAPMQNLPTAVNPEEAKMEQQATAQQKASDLMAQFGKVSGESQSPAQKGIAQGMAAANMIQAASALSDETAKDVQKPDYRDDYTKQKDSEALRQALVTKAALRDLDKALHPDEYIPNGANEPMEQHMTAAPAQWREVNPTPVSDRLLAALQRQYAEQHSSDLRGAPGSAPIRDDFSNPPTARFAGPPPVEEQAAMIAREQRRQRMGGFDRFVEGLGYEINKPGDLQYSDEPNVEPHIAVSDEEAKDIQSKSGFWDRLGRASDNANSAILNGLRSAGADVASHFAKSDEDGVGMRKVAPKVAESAKSVKVEPERTVFTPDVKITGKASGKKTPTPSPLPWAVSDEGAKDKKGLLSALKGETESDERVKYPVASALGDVPAVSFKYKPGHEPDETAARDLGVAPPTGPRPKPTRYGVLAQDLEQTPVTAPTVKPGPDGLKRVDTNQLTMTNTAAIGELHRRINELEGKPPQGGVPKPGLANALNASYPSKVAGPGPEYYKDWERMRQEAEDARNAYETMTPFGKPGRPVPESGPPGTVREPGPRQVPVPAPERASVPAPTPQGFSSAGALADEEVRNQMLEDMRHEQDMTVRDARKKANLAQALSNEIESRREVPLMHKGPLSRTSDMMTREGLATSRRKKEAFQGIGTQEFDAEGRVMSPKEEEKPQFFKSGREEMAVPGAEQNAVREDIAGTSVHTLRQSKDPTERRQAYRSLAEALGGEMGPGLSPRAVAEILKSRGVKKPNMKEIKDALREESQL